MTDGCAGDGDDELKGTASATEVIGTCGGADRNCLRAFTISPGANLSKAATNWPILLLQLLAMISYHVQCFHHPILAKLISYTGATD